jgi:hypothetical protein
MNASNTRAGARQDPSNSTPLTIRARCLLALAAGLLLAAIPARAVNILVNPGFETPPYGHSTNLVYPATGWTYFSPPEPAGYFGDFWVEGVVTPHSGSYYWKQWFGLSSRATNNVSGIYQTYSCSPGSTFDADGGLYLDSGDTPVGSYMWLQVEFIDSSSNLLAIYKSANFYASNAVKDVWTHFQATNVCDLTQPTNISPWFNTYAITGSVSQITAPAATFGVRYRYCYFASVGDGGSCYFDDANLDQLSGPLPPTITGLYPQNMILVPPSSNFTFNVSSGSGISSNAIRLLLNGGDVSSGLTFSGSPTSWNVTYTGLQSNMAYSASISITGKLETANTAFQTTWYGTMPATYLWEAEDWDFTNGMYFNNPDLCNAPGGANCYFGTVGTPNVDEYTVVFGSGSQYYVYRPAASYQGTAVSGDDSRPNLFAANRTDYCLNPYGVGNWVNYTRDWPANSTNWIIGRFANGTGGYGGATLSLVSASTTNVLGCFVVPATASYSTFEYVYLQNTNFDGQNANVVLNGKATLQLTASLPANSPYGNGGNCLPTFFMLVPAQVDLPFLSKLYPDGKHPFESTNALSFTVTTKGATFPANGIQMILDGNNVTSTLGITGSSSSNNVVYSGLEPNAMHVAIITVTNSLGHGIAITNQFDTFNQSVNASVGANICSNYMFEAEDYDFNGGQYISSASYVPDISYVSQISVTNIDFHHTLVAGEPTNGIEYNYRQNGIPQQLDNDYLRQIYINNFASDYQLNWFGGGDWANYTRDFPPGTYNVYARSSGLSAFTMTLGQVVSGLGTTNQVVKPIGQFSSTLPDINTFAWVPLTDAGGVAPVPVNITGVTTFQVLTPTGLCYPNYFMLVPTSAITASATRSGSNINISFPTQSGWGYRVFYRTNLTTGSWMLLNSAVGNGSVVSVTDTGPGDSQRFYKVTSP